MKQTICQKVSEGKPPVSNTGAENTFGLEALIDWCSFTLSSSYDDDGQNQESLQIPQDVIQVQMLLQIPSNDWVQMPRGGHGYKCQLRCGDISIFYDGTPDMGIHVNMSGQGCRYYESRFGNVWPDLFQRIFEAKGHFTRLDCAVDDFRGFFTLEQIEQKVENREVRSRFKKARGMTEYDLSSAIGQGDGKTVYFGSPTSDIQIRIYDKAVEQGIDQLWVRTEVQCRNERADVLAGQIVTENNLGQLLAGALRNYLAFIEPSGDSNKSRWSVSSWWDDFLGSVNKVQLTVRKVSKTVEEKMEWVDKQISTTLAVINRYLNNTGRDAFDYVGHLFDEGEKRLKPRHLALLQSA